jgi:hypothetical protein
VSRNEDGTESTQVDRPDALLPLETGADDLSRNIADALMVADLNALRVTLYQITGDPELRDMPLETVAIRNGRVWVNIVHRDYQDRLKAMATEYLRGEHRTTPPPPDQVHTLELLNMFAGEDLTESMAHVAFDNLALAGEPLEPSEGLKPGITIPSEFHVTVIGAGYRFRRHVDEKPLPPPASGRAGIYLSVPVRALQASQPLPHTGGSRRIRRVCGRSLRS